MDKIYVTAFGKVSKLFEILQISYLTHFCQKLSACTAGSFEWPFDITATNNFYFL